MVLQTKSTVIVFLLCFIGMVSCSKESAISTVSLENAAVLPSVHGENINALISDSGFVRYRVQAKVQDIYSGTEPYWFFPEGAYLEQYDSLFHVTLTVEADTVYFFEKKELWQLIGNVHIENVDSGFKFDTSELFWNPKAPPNSIEAFYVDTAKIVRIDMNNGYGILVSHGMKANQAITEYHFYNDSWEMLFDEDVPAPPGDSIPKTEIKQ